MKIQKLPWEYTIIDNFYDTELFNAMSIELTKFADEITDNIENKLVNKNLIYRFIRDPNTKSLWKSNYATKLFHKTSKCLDSRPLLESELDYFSYHREYKKLTLRSDVCIIFSNDVREDTDPIHYDSHEKILTAVTYVSPMKSRGTIIYDTNKKYVTEAPWKLNSTLISPPKTDVTYHSYETNPNNYRIVLNQFLVNQE